MSRFRKWLALTCVLPITACAGRYVTYTKKVELKTTIAIRENAAFRKFENINFEDLAKAKGDIPSSAQIKSLQITGLGLTMTVLPSTDASEFEAFLILKDAAGTENIITQTKKVGLVVQGVNVTSARTALTAIATIGFEAPLSKLQNQLNGFLESNTSITFRIGIGGIPEDGRIDIDMVPVVVLSVTYRVCESLPGNFFISMPGSNCTANPLESSPVMIPANSAGRVAGVVLAEARRPSSLWEDDRTPSGKAATA